MKLAGKTALVTGGGRGIGRSIALALADEGADVAVTARSSEQIESVADEIRERGRRAAALTCDVRNAEDAANSVNRAVADLNRIDILVNNAGGSFVRASVAESQPDDWRNVVEANLLGTYYCAHAALPYMIEQGGGKII
ncbi:MAG: SDR family NAD(P)-dependent oxidoreductase, partial [Pirellulaceae bacterium]|nr:SDR family NAD(P)-dependent oxidoreductase [Pirellulaceae bacterium]